MQYSSDQTSCLKFLDLFRNELLPLQGLLLDFLLDRSGMWADSKVVLDYLPGNTGVIRWFPGKHINIRPREGNKRAFLFVIEGGTDHKSTISTSQPCRDLLHLWCSDLGSLVIGTLRQVINRRSVLRRGTLPGFLARVLATLLLSSALLGRNYRCCCVCCDCVPVHLVHANDCVLLL